LALIAEVKQIVKKNIFVSRMYSIGDNRKHFV